MSIVIAANRLVDRSGVDNSRALRDLADDLLVPDLFRRMTAYTIVKTILDEMSEAVERSGGVRNSQMVMAEIKAQAGAMAGIAFAPQTKDRHKEFYLAWVAKLPL